MTATRGSVRCEVRIARPAEEVWAWVGDAARLPEWFPGITSCTVDDDMRVITTGSGLQMPERLLTIDRLLRRFQYRIESPFITEHLSTIDVHDMGDDTSLVVYGVDAEPSTMALIIGGAAGGALDRLRSLVEGRA